MAVSSSKGICEHIPGLAWLEDDWKEEEEEEGDMEMEERIAVEEEGE